MSRRLTRRTNLKHIGVIDPALLTLGL